MRIIVRMQDNAVKLNLPAPDFELPDLAGQPHRLSAQRGRVLVLNFWSAGCPWSERVDRAARELLAGWGSQVVWWNIASNASEPPETLERALRAHGLAPILVDRGAQVADLYGALTTPHLFVLDPDGMLRYTGAFDDVTFRQRTPTRVYLAEAVTALLAGRSPNPAETPPYGCTVVRWADPSPEE